MWVCILKRNPTKLHSSDLFVTLNARTAVKLRRSGLFGGWGKSPITYQTFFYLIIGKSLGHAILKSAIKNNEQECNQNRRLSCFTGTSISSASHAPLGASAFLAKSGSNTLSSIRSDYLNLINFKSPARAGKREWSFAPVNRFLQLGMMNKKRNQAA